MAYVWEIGPGKVKMSLYADMDNCQHAGHLLVHHGLKKQKSSKGDTHFESLEKIPAIDMRAQKTWFQLTMLCDAILKLWGGGALLGETTHVMDVWCLQWYIG